LLLGLLPLLLLLALQLLASPVAIRWFVAAFKDGTQRVRDFIASNAS
jgi:hypothetical protein